MIRSKKLSLTFVSFSLVSLLIISSCGPEPTPMAQSTPIPSGVEVTNITENDTVTSEIIQQKVFDQCDSVSPFKAQVQFSQSTGQESQQALVLGVKAGGEVGVSVAAKVKLEGSLEQHFANSKSSAQGHEEGIAIEVQPHTKQEYNIVWREIRREGNVEYIENGVSKAADYSYRIGLELVSAKGKDLICPGQEQKLSSPSSLPPSPPPTYTPLPTYTLYPTINPPTAVMKVVTATPIPTPTKPKTPQVLLDPHKPWEQNGLVLTLDDFWFNAEDKCVVVYFDLKNESDHPIILSGKARNFTTIDNLGQSWRLVQLGWNTFDSCSGDINEDWITSTISPGERLYHGCGGSCYGFEVTFAGNITDPNVEYVDVIVEDFSQITEAAWRIPIYH